MKLTIVEQIELRIEILEKWIWEKEHNLKKAPEGKLKVNRSGDNFYYYWRRDTSDVEGVYLPKPKMKKKAMQLAQKEYDERLIRKAKQEIAQLQKCCSFYEAGGSAENAYEELGEGKRLLVEKVEGNPEREVEEWLSISWSEANSYVKNYEYTTERGEKMRSKSELIIAEKLFNAEIPYHYEKPVTFAGYGTYYPDFTIYDVRHKREIILEHLGRMGDPSYVESNMSKLNMYQSNGYILGESLFLTFESDKEPLNTKIVDALISLLKERVVG